MRVLGSLIIVVLLSLMAGRHPVPINQNIIDLSWPNCGATTLPRATNGIVGVTGGLNFHPNPCLGRETVISKNLAAYVNTGYPGKEKAKKYSNFPKSCSGQDERCLAYNYGYNSGRYDANYALRSGLITNHWWLDVEFGNSWSDDPYVNRAELQGTLDALKPYSAKGKIGFYSYPFQWDIITANWRNGYPAWVASGSKQKQVAQKYCHAPSFSGAPVILSQYTAKLDLDLACS